MRASAHLLLFIVLTLVAGAAWAERRVVLVTSSDSPIDAISTLSIRKAYLGIPVAEDGVRVTAVRRSDDARLDEIFLQAVIAMSRKSYERRLLSMALKFGAPRPVVAEGYEAAVEALSSASPGICYMWQSEAESDPRVKIVKVLWQEF